MNPSFSELALSNQLIQTIATCGFSSPTLIQSRVIPKILLGHDICACAQTGSGKTAAFLWPLLDRLVYDRKRTGLPRAIILSPTRELAQQVFENFKLFSVGLPLKAAVLVGGEWMGEQERALRQKPDMIIATPGRLLDVLEREKFLPLDVGMLIIDEADRMLDMGFMPDVERLLQVLPPRKQTVLISATYPDTLKSHIDALMPNATYIQAQASAKPVQTITQYSVTLSRDQLPEDLRSSSSKKQSRETHRGYTKNGRTAGETFTSSPKAQDIYDLKRMALRALLKHHDSLSSIVFCNTKRDVDIVAKSLNAHKFKAMPIHGDLDQRVRNETLDTFRHEKGWVLVASDVAARGIDIDDLPLVINFDLPMNAEDYVHRIGRTGRAGKSGIAYSLIESGFRKDTERLQAILNLMNHDQMTPFDLDLKDEFEKRLLKQKKTSEKTRDVNMHEDKKLINRFTQHNRVQGFGDFIPHFMHYDPGVYFTRGSTSSSTKKILPAAILQRDTILTDVSHPPLS